MQKTKEAHRNRLSIDVNPEFHRLIKINAAMHNQTIREYVLDIIKKNLSKKVEIEDLHSMVADIGPILKELWDNRKDADYDRL